MHTFCSNRRLYVVKGFTSGLFPHKAFAPRQKLCLIEHFSRYCFSLFQLHSKCNWKARLPVLRRIAIA